MSLEDLFQNNLCICGHTKEEHEGNCYSLHFNGTIYSACRCPRFIAKALIFKVEIQNEDSIPIQRGSIKTTTKQAKQNFFQLPHRKVGT